MVSLWLAVALAQDAVVCGRGAAPPATVTCDASLLSDALTLIPPGGTVHLYGDIVDPVTATQSFTLVGIPDGTGTLPEWSTRSADLFTVDCGGACVIELSNLLMDSNGERAVVLADGGSSLTLTDTDLTSSRPVSPVGYVAVGGGGELACVGCTLHDVSADIVISVINGSTLSFTASTLTRLDPGIFWTIQASG